MTIPPTITIPSLGIGAAAAGIPMPVVVLCVLAPLARPVLTYLTDRDRAQRDDDFRKLILTNAAGLPAGEHAAVLCELARALNPSGNPAPPADPSAPGRAP